MDRLIELPDPESLVDDPERLARTVTALALAALHPNVAIDGEPLDGETDLTSQAGIRTPVGGVNIVSVVADRWVVKVPKTINQSRVAMLRNESLALQFLAEKGFSGYAVPRLVQFSPRPAYLISSYVPGNTLSAAEVGRLSITDRKAMGNSFGEYLFHQIATVDCSEPTETVLDENVGSWFDFFDANVGSFAATEYPSLSYLAESLRQKWRPYTETLAQRPQYFIHGDLTIANAAFGDDLQVVGVFDWAKAHFGGLAEELSTLFDSDAVVFQTCLDRLGVYGVAPPLAEVLLWREMKDVSFLIRALSDTTSVAFSKYREITTGRRQEMNWIELYANNV